MALDRWIAFFILLISLIYGYAAFFTMDHLLPPVMQRNPIWPSSFPKVLAVCAVLTSLAIVLGLEKSQNTNAVQEIDLSRLKDYNVGQALALIGLMVAYAVLLRPIGFLSTTFLFLAGGSFILGERRIIPVVLIATIATAGVWYLVDRVLGIFLLPFPVFMMGN